MTVGFSELDVGDIVELATLGDDELADTIRRIGEAFDASVAKPAGFGKATVVLEEALVGR